MGQSSYLSGFQSSYLSELLGTHKRRVHQEELIVLLSVALEDADWKNKLHLLRQQFEASSKDLSRNPTQRLFFRNRAECISLIEGFIEGEEELLATHAANTGVLLIKNKNEHLRMKLCEAFRCTEDPFFSIEARAFPKGPPPKRIFGPVRAPPAYKTLTMWAELEKRMAKTFMEGTAERHLHENRTAAFIVSSYDGVLMDSMPDHPEFFTSTADTVMYHTEDWEVIIWLR